MTRNEILLRGANHSTRILEIGPGYNPVAPKCEGWNTHIIDHASADELRAKYTSAPVDVGRIEDVDTVWTDGLLHEAVPASLQASFELVIASHVLEHVPDFVGSLMSLSHLLRHDGVISIALPDKRFCFDYFKPISTTADVLEAFRSNRTRHSFRSIWGHVAYAASLDGKEAWGQGPIASSRFIAPFRDVVNAYRTPDSTASDPYVDCHAWHFTPASLSLIMFELQQLGVVDWKLEDISGPLGCEFFVSLRRGPKNLLSADRIQEIRMRFLQDCLSELDEQVRFALDGGLLDPAKKSGTSEVARLEAKVSALELKLSQIDPIVGRVTRWFRRLDTLRGRR